MPARRRRLGAEPPLDHLQNRSSSYLQQQQNNNNNSKENDSLPYPSTSASKSKSKSSSAAAAAADSYPEAYRAHHDDGRALLQPLASTYSSYSSNNSSSNSNQHHHHQQQQQLPPVAATMTSRDRTQEFSNAILSMRSRNLSRAQLYNKSPRQLNNLQSYTDFMLIAKSIGKNIANTYSKLEKLAMLAKKKSIFDDRQMEIEELTCIIKTDLSSLNKQIARLQDLGRKQREQFSASKGHHIASHSSSVVVALQSKLANMSNHFKCVLEVRSEKMREEQSRREQFSHGSVSTMHHLPGKQSSLLLQEQDRGASSVSIDLEPAMGSMSMQAAVYDDTDSYLQSRAETMQNIESTIVELGGIFQQLAHMVKEQEEMVERIDSNIEDTELNVVAAHTEILKYFQSVTNNRWLMIKIFGVLIFFFIFFTVFLA